MICPICKEQGSKSKVYPGLTMSTALGWTPGYYDENGNYVENEDPNYHTTYYTCSNGHEFSATTRYGETTLKWD